MANETAIAMIEFSSIARGIDATDAMLKKADVELLLARTICPGKYLSLVRGDLSTVESSLEAGVEQAGDTVVDTLLLPNPHPTIFPALHQTTIVESVEALGILEGFTMAATIVAADTAAKAAYVDLLEIRMSIMLAGKSFLTLTGEERAVRTAVARGAESLREKGLLVAEIVIPYPHRRLLPFLL